MSKSNVSPIRKDQENEHQEVVATALVHARNQIARTCALIAGAKARLQDADEDHKDTFAIELLEMAENEIGDYNQVIRLAQLAGYTKD
jgi:hypothetical protein